MGTMAPVKTIEEWEYNKLLAGLNARTLSVTVTIDQPLPAGVSNDEALLTLAQGKRYVLWGKAIEGSRLGNFSEVRIVDRERAAELINAGATWAGDESDNPAS
jgi:hypothetical protein